MLSLPCPADRAPHGAGVQSKPEPGPDTLQPVLVTPAASIAPRPRRPSCWGHITTSGPRIFCVGVRGGGAVCGVPLTVMPLQTLRRGPCPLSLAGRAVALALGSCSPGVSRETLYAQILFTPELWAGNVFREQGVGVHCRVCCGAARVWHHRPWLNRLCVLRGTTVHTHVRTGMHTYVHTHVCAHIHLHTVVIPGSLRPEGVVG